MKPQDLKNMFIGRTVYYVHAFRAGHMGSHSDQCFMTKYFVHGVFKSKFPSNSWFATAKNEEGHWDEFSFMDCNALPNHYNCHRLFRSLEEAEHYMAHPELWKPLGV